MDKKKLYDYCMNSPENTNPAIVLSLADGGGSLGENNNIVKLNCTSNERYYYPSYTGVTVDRPMYTLPEGYAFGEPTRGGVGITYLKPSVQKDKPIYILNANYEDYKTGELINVNLYPIGTDFKLYYYKDEIFTGWVGACNDARDVPQVVLSCYLEDRTKFVIWEI